jgi:multiple sugar transport system substrate-binding protein
MPSEHFTRRALLKRSFNLGLASGMISELLPGCNSTPHPISQHTGMSAIVRPLHGPITIKWYSEGGSVNLYKNLTQLFHDQYPNITISWQEQQDHDTLIGLLVNHHQEPAIFSVDVGWIDEFVGKGVMLPLDDLWPSQERGRYHSVAIDGASVNGVVYAAPFRIDLGVLYYRTDLFSNPPYTWDELASMVQGLDRSPVNKKVPPYGYLWQGKTGQDSLGRDIGEGLICNFLEVLADYGGKLEPNDPQTITSPQAVDALRRMVQWVDGISPSMVTDLDEEGTLDLWKQGKAAFMRNWPYGYVESNQRGLPVGGKFDVAPLPGKGKYPGASCLGGWFLAINPFASSDEQEAAWEFIHWMMQDGAQFLTAYENSWLPALQSVYHNQDILAKYPFFNTILTIIEHNAIVTRPRTPCYQGVTGSQYISKIVRTHIHEALLKQVSSEQALQAIRSDLSSFACHLKE